MYKNKPYIVLQNKVTTKFDIYRTMYEYNSSRYLVMPFLSFKYFIEGEEKRTCGKEYIFVLRFTEFAHLTEGILNASGTIIVKTVWQESDAKYCFVPRFFRLKTGVFLMTTK